MRERGTSKIPLLGAESTSAQAPSDDTNWFAIRQAAAPSDPQFDCARESVCRRYRRPVCNFLTRQGYSPEDAEDLAQTFFTRLLEKNSLSIADQARGRFRSLLLTMLKRFVADQRALAATQKRGGNVTLLSLNEGDTEHRARMEPSHSETPEKSLERTWASCILTQGLERLRSEQVRALGAGQSEILTQFIAGEHPGTYAELANSFGWSETKLKVTIHRMRRRLAILVREQFAEQGASPSEIEQEIEDLLAAFRPE